jgi:hypothetical protein
MVWTSSGTPPTKDEPMQIISETNSAQIDKPQTDENVPSGIQLLHFSSRFSAEYILVVIDAEKALLLTPFKGHLMPLVIIESRTSGADISWSTSQLIA